MEPLTVLPLRAIGKLRVMAIKEYYTLPRAPSDAGKCRYESKQGRGHSYIYVGHTIDVF